MRPIDADEALAGVKPYEPSDEMWSCTGGTAIRLIHNAIDNAPTLAVVPVSELLELRDKLYEADGITMNGLKLLNQLIAKYSSGKRSNLAQVVRCQDCVYHRIFLGRDMCAKNATVLDGHEVSLRATEADNFCSYGTLKEKGEHNDESD